MPQFKSTQLLQNATVAVCVGDRPQQQRSALRAIGLGALLFVGGALGTAQAQQPGQVATAPQAQAQNQPVIAEVLSVRHIYQDNRHDSRESRPGRVRISSRTIAGALVGGFLGHQVGGGDGKKVATIAGVFAGGSIANRLGDRRKKHNEQQDQGYANARRVEDNNLVTVSVPVAGLYETYEIVQPAAIPVKRGDMVELRTTNEGQTLLALPMRTEMATETRPRSTRPGR